MHRLFLKKNYLKIVIMFKLIAMIEIIFFILHVVNGTGIKKSTITRIRIQIIVYL